MNGSFKVVIKDYKGIYVSMVFYVKVNFVSCGCGFEFMDFVVDVVVGVVVGCKVVIVF